MAKMIVILPLNIIGKGQKKLYYLTYKVTSDSMINERGATDRRLALLISYC